MLLKKPSRPKALISLVPMIDVLLILLVFFMVTSTYLDLDMIPLAERADETMAAAPAPSMAGVPLILRLGADGQAYVRGQPLPTDTLGPALLSLVEGREDTEIILLPSARASTQSLVSLMDAVSGAGLSRLRIVRLETRP